MPFSFVKLPVTAWALVAPAVPIVVNTKSLALVVVTEGCEPLLLVVVVPLVALFWALSIMLFMSEALPENSYKVTLILLPEIVAVIALLCEAVAIIA